MAEIVEGRNPVAEALKSGRPISRVLLARNMPRHSAVAEILHLARDKGIPVEYVDRRVIDQKSQTGASQGIVAYAAATEYVDLDDLFAVSKARNEPALYLLLDGVEDPRNLGAILRTAEATGVHGVITRTRRAVGLTAAVATASAGAVEYVQVARVVNIPQTIEALKKQNVWVIGIDMTGDVEYTQVNFMPATALVIGGEGKGLSELVRKRCDSIARIPMKGRINSLNASRAAAVVMDEVMRQRNEG